MPDTANQKSKKVNSGVSPEAEDRNTVEDIKRRMIIKTLVGGATAVAVYNLFPSKWKTPVIESVFLPAHAATSDTSNASGSGSGNSSPIPPSE